MKRIAISVLVLSLSAAAIGASAAQDTGYYPQHSDRDGRYDDNRYGSNHYASNNQRTDMAQVLRAEPMYDQYGSYQRQECWNEQTNRFDDGYYRDGSGRLYRGDGNNTDRAIIGGIVGGALGNQVGKGDGRTAATIAGVVIGATIGNNSGRNDGYDRYSDNSGIVRRCRTITNRDGRQGISGYNVTYRYGGYTYHAVTRRHPGRSMRVVIDVRPQDENIAHRY